MFYISICFYIIAVSFFQTCAERVETEDGEKYNECQTTREQGDLNSFLWTLKRDPPSYFFGTIHVPYTRVWEHIPENTKTAFKQSENIFFELDLTNPYTMSALAKCQLLPHGESLSNILPTEMYTRLKEHLDYVRETMPSWMTADQKGKGLYADYLFNVIAGNWERKRPIWVMLMVNSLTESDIKSREIPVLDLYLAQEAERMRKVTGAVEEVEEQCVPLNELNFSQVLFALNQTLWQHESYRLRKSAIPYTTDDLIYHYNCGDLDSIIFNRDSSQVSNLLNTSLPPDELKTAKLIDNYFRTKLINTRNKRMAERVADLLNENPNESFFFAFGAGHFLGNDTVVDRLQRMGFPIEHTLPDQQIPRFNSTSLDYDWEEGLSPYLSTKSTGLPLSTSVFPGDLEYFVKNRLKLHRRQKNKRRNKLQEEFGDIWDQMDEESRNWLEQSRSERRKQYDSNKPFNDLWIRIETPRPDVVQKLTDRDPSHSHSGVPHLQTDNSNSATSHRSSHLADYVTVLLSLLLVVLS